jgi:predicted RNA methylase
MMATIKDDVLTILSKAEINDNVIILNCGQLDRKMYLSVNEVLENMGGKWNRKLKGHVFDADPTNKLEDVLLTGEIETNGDIGYFPTPKEIVEQLIELAEIESGMEVLEPSAGEGAIADELNKLDINLTLVEFANKNCDALKQKGYKPYEMDFLTMNQTKKFDRIVMNPPFAKQQDIDHVMKAFSLLKPNGKLVSVMSASVKFRENNKTTEFRKTVEASNGKIINLPEGSFKQSGTMVNTVIVVMG